MDALNIIDDWLNELEHSVKFKTAVMIIHGPCKPVICIATYENHNCPPDFGKLSLYNMSHLQMVCQTLQGK